MDIDHRRWDRRGRGLGCLVLGWRIWSRRTIQHFFRSVCAMTVFQNWKHGGLMRLTSRYFPRLASGLLVAIATAAAGVAPPSRYVVDVATVRDTRSGLIWQRVLPASTYSQAGAQQYCSALNLGGMSGWRAPSIKELQTLLDPREVGPPSIDTTAFPSTLPGYYWSSTSSNNAGQAWALDSQGQTARLSNTTTNRVRCVR